MSEDRFWNKSKPKARVIERMIRDKANPKYIVKDRSTGKEMKCGREYAKNLDKAGKVKIIGEE